MPHATQGSWSSAINWFRDSRAGVSAHYTVRSSDGFVGQSAQEKDVALHAGNDPYNFVSVGIEHEGYMSDPKWWTESIYRGSARLAGYLCNKYGIPPDRYRIIGHNQIPDPGDPGLYGGQGNHKDPDPYWNWDKYMSYVRQYATAWSSRYWQVVTATSGRFSASGRWASSNSNGGRFGARYRLLNPAPVFDPAKFRLAIPARGTYSIHAWWPAQTANTTAARFRILTASGWVVRAVNQRTLVGRVPASEGYQLTTSGRWVSLGSHVLNAGDGYTVEVDSRSAASGYIVADAVRVIRW